MSDKGYSDMDIQALVDNELTFEKAALVRASFEFDFEAKERYESLLRQKQLLLAWWRDKKSH